MPSVLIYVVVSGYASQALQPVQAMLEHNDCYRILDTEINPDPEHEYWEFAAGDAVRCELVTFAEGETGLVARSRC